METYFIPSTYYSDIPNKRAGHNKQAGWNDLLVYVSKLINEQVDDFLFIMYLHKVFKNGKRARSFIRNSKVDKYLYYFMS